MQVHSVKCRRQFLKELLANYTTLNNISDIVIFTSTQCCSLMKVNNYRLHENTCDLHAARKLEIRFAECW